MQGEQVVQRHRIDAGVDPARRLQRLRRRGEAEAAEVFAVVQRLDAEAVARQEQRLAVPDGEREHAVQALDAGFAPFQKRPQDDFGVAVGVKNMAARDQLDAQFRVVVDGAVEHQRDAAGGVEHRLPRVLRQIDDRQPPVPQPHRPIGVLALGIGPAPRQLGQHAIHRRRVGRLVVEPEFTCYAAHSLLRYPRRTRRNAKDPQCFSSRPLRPSRIMSCFKPPAALRPSTRSARAIRGCVPASTAAY